jgi:hypothetical protein
VGHGKLAKWPTPRAGTLDRPSPPGTEPPHHPQTSTAPPFSRPWLPLVPTGHYTSFTYRPYPPPPLGCHRSQTPFLLLAVFPHPLHCTALPCSSRRRAAPRQAMPSTSHQAKHCRSCRLMPGFTLSEHALSSSCVVSKHHNVELP